MRETSTTEQCEGLWQLARPKSDDRSSERVLDTVVQRAGLTKLSSDASFDDEFPSSSSPPTASNIALLPAAPVMTE